MSELSLFDDVLFPLGEYPDPPIFPFPTFPNTHVPFAFGFAYACNPVDAKSLTEAVPLAYAFPVPVALPILKRLSIWSVDRIISPFLKF